MKTYTDFCYLNSKDGFRGSWGIGGHICEIQTASAYHTHHLAPPWRREAITFAAAAVYYGIGHWTVCKQRGLLRTLVYEKVKISTANERWQIAVPESYCFVQEVVQCDACSDVAVRISWRGKATQTNIRPIRERRGFLGK
ncbi:hypothetical protein BaRGS_00001804 [Batillaria attramentaria]|uniref:Uncharacterized protein n=1 Tax=Batillaria attramentaria TaxID=370345 RepID=A0ABD0M641_9CAEN